MRRNDLKRMSCAPSIPFGGATVTGTRNIHDGFRIRRMAILIILGASLFAAPRQALADELADLKATIKALEARVQALEAERAAAKAAPPPAAPSPTEAKAVAVVAPPLFPSIAAPFTPNITIRSDEVAAQRIDNAPIDPALKGFFKIPGTDTIMKVGGYAKLDFIYDAKPIGTFDYFVTSAIPTSGPGTLYGTQFTAHAKQTRMNVDLRRDTEAGPARIFVEADWFGDPSVDFQPGGYQLRLRHAFGQLNNVAAGYSFSAFMDNDALPDTLDFEGPGAAPYLLDAQGRYTWKLGKNLGIGLSLEAPQSQVTAPTGTGKSTFPDVGLRARYEDDPGHLQVSGIFRRLGWSSGTGTNDYTGGYGLNIAGSLKTIGEDYMVAGGVWGKGIARYISDIGGLGLDAVVDPNGNLQALEEYGGYAAYTHYWLEKLRTTAVVGYLGMGNQPYQSSTSFTNSQYYSANLIWNPWGSLSVGVEVLYGRFRTFDGLSANDTRIQMSAQYDFVR